MIASLEADALLALHREGYVAQLIASGLLTEGPFEAVARLAQRYGDPPNRDGANCAGIVALRDLIERASARLNVPAAALMITAPHTHWGDRLTIESFDSANRRYLIGPQRPVGRMEPVSFALSADGPVAYEWADGSTRLDAQDLAAAWRLIEAVNEAAFAGGEPAHDLPLGLAINHRFKRICGPPLFSTMENPLDDEIGMAEICIDTTSEADADRFEGQVGWSPVAPSRSASAADLRAVRLLESELSSLSIEEAETVLDLLAGRRG